MFVVHFLDPREFVPLCMVLDTWDYRDQECVVVKSAEGTTCPECLAGLAEKSGLYLGNS